MNFYFGFMLPACLIKNRQSANDNSSIRKCCPQKNSRKLLVPFCPGNKAFTGQKTEKQILSGERGISPDKII